VAVKILHCCGTAAAQQVLEEVDVMMRLDHQNVVHTFHSVMWQRHDPLGGDPQCGDPLTALDTSSSCLAPMDGATASFGSSSCSSGSSSFSVYPVITSCAKNSTDCSAAAAAATQLLLQHRQPPVMPLGGAASEDDEGLESRFWIVQVRLSCWS